MDPKQLIALDKRHLNSCVYCGGRPETRDHVPSRVLLDDPLPDNLPVVDACLACNQGFSLDEEYLACFLDAVLSGTADPEKMAREKVRNTLVRNSRLAKRIENSVHVAEDGTQNWTPELDRVQNVVMKLARGHTAYELGEPRIDDPVGVGIRPFLAMSDEEKAGFEGAGSEGRQLWPEIGSRAFLVACGDKEPCFETDGSWLLVQPMRYRYSVVQGERVNVRIVLAEYLACHVAW